MSTMMSTICINGLTACVQVLVLIGLTPLCVWTLDAVPLLACGRSVLSLQHSYGRFFGVLWKGIRVGFWPREGLAFAFALVVFWAFPGFTLVQKTAEGQVLAPMGDPLLIGGVLLLGSAFLMPVLTIGRYLGAVLVLCMTEMLVVVAAPGVNGLLGVHTALTLAPGSGLAGTSICCALALAVSAPLPTTAELTQFFTDASTPKQRIQRDQNRVLMGFFRLGWLLLVADLLLPVLVGGHGWAGFVALIARLVITLLIVVFIKLVGAERYPRLVALLVGLAFLIALAGRFAT